jgi:hypothetical protein
MARGRRSGGARLGLASLLSLAGILAGAEHRAGAASPDNGDPAWLAGYRVAATCPDAHAFRSAVERRRARPTTAADDGIRSSVEITSSRSPVAYSGAIEVSLGGEHTRREVAGAACAEVVEALSLIAAMALDAGAGSADVERGPRVEASASAESDDARDREQPAPEPAPDTFQDLVLGAGALAIAHGAAAPRTAWGAGVGLALEWTARAWQPALLVSAFRATGGDVLLAGGAARARFELLAGAAQLCPLRVPGRGRWALRPCLELELGQLSGTSSGSAVRGAATRSGVWSSGGLGLRGDVGVWGPLRISASISAVAPLARHEYSFSPDATTAFRVPALSLRATGLVGVFF